MFLPYLHKVEMICTFLFSSKNKIHKLFVRLLSYMEFFKNFETVILIFFKLNFIFAVKVI
jgi:hypothetical protein